MSRPSCRAAALAAALLLAPVFAFAQADYARERRWAEEVVPAIVVGDPVWLTLASGRSFLAIYARDRAARHGVVVVHGSGVHPDWGLINILRSRLAEQGYATLAVQMPVLAADARPADYAATFPEAAQRLAAAVEYLRGKGFQPAAIVSHSMGARMSDYFLSVTADPGIAAWVAIGLPGDFSDPGKLRLPVLDLYGANDLAAVRDNAPRRAAALARLRGSAQVEVDGADHFFDGHESDLVQWTRRFLDRALR